MDKSKFFKNNAGKINSIFGKLKKYPIDWVSNPIETDEGVFEVYFNANLNKFTLVGADKYTKGLSLLYSLKKPFYQIVKEDSENIIKTLYDDKYDEGYKLKPSDIFEFEEYVGERVFTSLIKKDDQREFKPVSVGMNFTVVVEEYIEVELKTQEEYDEYMAALDNYEISSSEDVQDYGRENNIEVRDIITYDEHKETLEVSDNNGRATIIAENSYNGKTLWNNKDEE